MKTAKLNYFIDLLMTISFLITTISGLVLFFFLPGGQKRGGYQEFLGIVRHDWVNLHNWSGFFFIFFWHLASCFAFTVDFGNDEKYF